MKEKVKVILKDGSQVTLAEWQMMYGLKIGSDKIGVNFSYTEKAFLRDIRDYGEVIVNELLMRVLDAFRDRVQAAVNINSFNRNDDKQKRLVIAGFRAAVFSPHVVKMAADIDTTSKEQTYEWVDILREVSKDLGIKIRIGFQDYLNNGQTFIHLDVCPEYYAPGKPCNQSTHPAAWERAISW